ncbi:sensor histidine kinase [Nakamurella endophytica]|uniref:histidine kinase n=1 Tax=Nakamurella endophytica TaxID=1748367 RepID=A0A917WCH6_9ACTN|nr:HAMP domain-containing sensor histidine kinase [Nakamurella endophytica]GGL94319.1 two-component sensor histidine kinase [Nakamurella endophytica]
MSLRTSGASGRTAGTPQARPLRTGSLRARTIAAVLAAVAITLLAVGVFLDVLLRARLVQDLRERLLDRASYAQLLATQGLSPQTLADRLADDDTTVTFAVDGSTVYGRPAPAPPPRPPGPARPAPPPPAGAVLSDSGDRLTVTAPLTGGTLTLTASRLSIDHTLTRLRGLETAAALASLAVLALVLTGIVTRVLRPLRRMTTLATDIARGGRGGRLRPTRPGTELGRTAAAFDDMLAALETAETTARRAAADAAAAEERMQRLLSDVAHELRTPIAGLQATAETLLRDNPTRQDRERLTLGMIRTTGRAGRLVDDLLLMTRLDAGADLGPVSAVDLAELAGSVVQEQHRLAGGSRVRLRPSPDAWVRGDLQRLAQVLTNLVDNARHATADGDSIDVAVRRDGDTVVVEVQDTGPGVAADDRARIFERFVRLGVPSPADGGGSGLGLPIARAIAQAHGGTLTHVGGPAARGSTFVLRLPALSPAARAVPAVTADGMG